MSVRLPRCCRPPLAVSLLACAAALISVVPARTYAQVLVANPQQNVGGVAIDPDGVIRKLDRQQQDELRRIQGQFLKNLPDDFKQPGVKLRKLSLKQLQQAALDSVKDNGGKLPDEVRFLAGLQRVRYVFVYPELKDVVLVGPAEAWHVNDDGEVVGVTTGRPVLQFDDLVVALRTAAAATRQPITCSIGPTADGTRRYSAFFSQLKQHRQPGPIGQQIISAAEQAMGLQTITLSGIDTSTHFARILVAADYQMKRLAMGFDAAPVAGMPSFVQMVRSPHGKNTNPRWWLQDDYRPLLTDGEGLAWELRGPGVKTMTEDELVAANGTRHGTGHVDPLAQKWANSMTSHYDALSTKEAIFGQLRNCMDLAVVSALIISENLHGKAGLDLSPMLESDSLAPGKFAAPRHVPTLVNAMQKAGGWLITASGGVSVNPWQVVAKREKSTTLAPQREVALPPAGAAWWWN